VNKAHCIINPSQNTHEPFCLPFQSMKWRDADSGTLPLPDFQWGLLMRRRGLAKVDGLARTQGHRLL